MFDLASGWKTRLAGAVLPPRSEKAGWLIDHSAGPAFVEPALRTIQGDPFAARAIVVAAPGAVGIWHPKGELRRALPQDLAPSLARRGLTA
jgi:hypothetical protein